MSKAATFRSVCRDFSKWSRLYKESTYGILHSIEDRGRAHANSTTRYKVTVFIHRLVCLGDKSVHCGTSDLYNLDIWLEG